MGDGVNSIKPWNRKSDKRRWKRFALNPHRKFQKWDGLWAPSLFIHSSNTCMDDVPAIMSLNRLSEKLREVNNWKKWVIVLLSFTWAGGQPSSWLPFPASHAARNVFASMIHPRTRVKAACTLQTFFSPTHLPAGWRTDTMAGQELQGNHLRSWDLL